MLTRVMLEVFSVSSMWELSWARHMLFVWWSSSLQHVWDLHSYEDFPHIFNNYRYLSCKYDTWHEIAKIFDYILTVTHQTGISGIVGTCTTRWHTFPPNTQRSYIYVTIPELNPARLHHARNETCRNVKDFHRFYHQVCLRTCTEFRGEFYLKLSCNIKNLGALFPHRLFYVPRRVFENISIRNVQCSKVGLCGGLRGRYPASNVGRKPKRVL